MNQYLRYYDYDANDSKYTYDKFGRVATTKMHGNDVNSTNYAYNIRGWVVDVFHPYIRQQLTYNNGTTGFNGNITKMTWRTANNSEQNYSFTYDGANRMLDAIYSEGVSSSQNLNRYTEKVTEYDKNGNIKKLQRYGQTGASSYGLVDNLTYTYNGNKVTRVDDATTATSYTGGTNFINGASTNNEYTYDANGNLTKDLNKNISNIQYNSLNLPSVVTFSDGSTITYTYTHDGKKLRTVHVIGGVTTTTDYCGNVIYENGTAKKLLTDGGYVDLTTTTPTYYYYLTDHQGNNRAVISAVGSSVLETNHYYPFGGLFATSTSVQPYKYNGKELDTKKGLNLYDYGARHYDAALGRWHVVDPMAEKMGAWSPYAYCYNNPMKFVDEEGESPLKVLKAAFNVGKRMYKTYKRSGKLNLKQALKDEGLNIVDNVKRLFDDNASTSEQIFAGIDLITGFGGEIKDASKSLGIIDDAVDTSKNANKASKARFIGDVDGKVIDTKMTPKGTYVQPNGSETDVLGREHKNKIGSGKTISVGTSHTHNKGKNVAPNGKVYEYREDKAHIPTYDEIINIIDGNAKRK